jgi:transcriptional regulator with PAS, ATPase and Fis domain
MGAQNCLKIAEFDFLDLLLIGESGVGKTHYAELIHQNSARRAKPFVAINCAAIPADLLEAELFGSVKGAFTGAIGAVGKFEAAEGGTIFLDEIGELDASIQAKLLTVIEDKTIRRVGSNQTKKLNLRFIFATNQNLTVFRNDFLYRIAGYTLEIEPLRSRRQEIRPLAQKFLSDFNSRNNQSLFFTEEVFESLRLQDWRGNVRELKNFVVKLAVNAMLDSQKRIDRRFLSDTRLPELSSPVSDSQIMRETYPRVVTKRRDEILTANEQRAFELYYKNKNLKVKDILAQTNVSRATFYRKLNGFAPAS